MDGMHFPLKKWAVRAIQSHIDTHYIEMMSMNHTTNFNHIMQIALISLNCHPLLSLLASAIESYLPQQQIGWHPTLFLDHVLDKRLSIMQKKHLNQQERFEIYKKFKNIDGNSICPCLKKRKKYKNCCGASRIL